MSVDGIGWDAFQREALAEMGLRPYALAGMEAEAAAPSDVPGAAASPPKSNPHADALLRALARAAGCEPGRIADWPELAGLRGDARAKRALWPKLRRLHAERRGATRG